MSSDDNDKSTEKVLEYYQKYSQNRNLSKYFSGTSVSYLPPITAEVDDEPNSSQPPLVPQITISESKEDEYDSSSSASEHKKLEWDNGADIGYKSARKNSENKIQKCSSLPILNSVKTVSKSVPSTVISHSTSEENIDILVFSSPSTSSSAKHCSSSSSVANNTKQPQTTTDTSSEVKKSKSTTHSESDETRFEDFQKTINFLKLKIGLPGAHSTPYVMDNITSNFAGPSGNSSATLLSRGSSSKSESQEKTKSRSIPTNTPSDSVSAEVTRLKKRENVQSKTSSSSLSSKSSPKKSKRKVDKKVVELSISTPISVNCQGLNVASSDKTIQTCNAVAPKAVQTVQAISQNIETQSGFHSEEKMVQTSFRSENVFSEQSASSFEYISLKPETQITPVLLDKTTSISGVLKQVSVVKSTTESNNVSTTSSEEIDRHLGILQKLIKTKKMNSSMKRKYIKRLLKDLNDLETSQDSNTSSDLFIPRKDAPKLTSKVGFKEVDDFIPPFQVEHNFLAYGDNNFLERGSVEEKGVQVEHSISNSTGKEKEFDGTKAQNGSISSDQKSDSKQTSGGAESSTFISSQIFKQSSSKTYDTAPMKSESTGTALVPINDKATQPFSTKLLSIQPSDDYLLKFAENERTYQLNWINNEITHLSKLKGILELKSRKLSDAKSQSSTNSYNVLQKTSNSARNYVIQTNLDVGGQQTAVNYLLQGQEYVVTDSQKSSSDADRAIMADIQVEASQSRTNIKVSTICSTCKQIVCVCSNSKTGQSKFSSLPTETQVKSEDLYESVDQQDGSKSDTHAVNSESGTNHWSSSLGSEDLIDQEDYNSLQKVFEKCSCTRGKPNCRCDFVKKLLDKFRVQRNFAVGTDEDRQSDMVEPTEPQADEHISLKVLKDVFTQTKNTKMETALIREDLYTQSSVNGKSKNSFRQNSVQTQTLEKKLRDNSIQSDIAQTVAEVQVNGKNTVSARQSTVHTQTYRKKFKDDTVQAVAIHKDKSTQSTQQQRSVEVQINDKSRVSTIHSHTSEDTISRGELENLHMKSSNRRLKKLSRQNTVETQSSRVQSKDEEVQIQDEVNSPVNHDTQTRANSKEAKVNTRQARQNCQIQAEQPTLSSDAQTKANQRFGADTQTFRKVSLDDQVQVGVDRGDHFVQTEQVSERTEDSSTLVAGPWGKDAVLITGRSSTVATSEAFPENKTQSAAVPVELHKMQSVERATRHDKNGLAGSRSLQSNSTNFTPPPTLTSSSSSSASSRITCSCCKQKAFLAEVSYLQEGNDSLAVCSRCYYNRPRYCSHNAKFMCRCWAYWHAKHAVDTGQLCNCRSETATSGKKQHRVDFYTVTLKDEKPRRRRKYSEGIKVREGWSAKSLKDKENGLKKQEVSEEVIEDKDEMEKDKRRKKSKRVRGETGNESDSQYTLTEYLIRNRPEFICSAEYRRQMLLNSRILRERRKDALKLNFLENNLKSPDGDKFKLFTEREMKDINRKNYKKLPEVQGRLVRQKENQLRRADRLITNIFAKRIQKSVLRGKGNFPIDRPMTSL